MFINAIAIAELDVVAIPQVIQGELAVAEVLLIVSKPSFARVKASKALDFVILLIVSSITKVRSYILVKFKSLPG